ncbi:MAG: outer membrane beta-barrel protein, partial [Terriglobales bacterium]
MSLRAESSFTRKAALILVLALTAALLAPAARAQSSEEPVPKVEIFAGYAWMEPGAKVLGVALDSMPKGFGVSTTYNFNKHWGLTFDSGGHWDNNAHVGTIMVGPQVKWRGEHVSPFIHFLVGAHFLAVEGTPTDTAFGLAAGGGLDLHLSRRVDFRLIEADYIYSHHTLTPTVVIPISVPTTLNGGRLRTGLVFKLGGGPPPPPPSCSVSADSMEVMAGEPVHATVNAANFPKGRTLSYTWSSSGGKVSGTDMGASVDTTGMAPGSYSVSAHVSDNKKASADCSGHFTVKEPPKHPPQLSCSANPATVRSGEASTISCTCTSPDNRSLSYSWNSSAGQLSPTDASATLDTAGLPSGPVNVNTTCTDDRGLSDATTTTVNVEVPVVITPSKLGECDFTTARVDNKCKAVLDDVALRLQRDADAKLVIVGYSGPKESKKMAAQRAVNAKKYLTKGNGIDPSRIEVRTGMDGGKRAEFYLVPAGATFSDANTEVVMEKA